MNVTPARVLPVAALLTVLAAVPTWAHRGLDEQIQDVTRRLEESPKDASLYLKRGELHRAHGDWDLARRDYEAARALDPSMAAVDLCMGSMWLDSGKPAEARAALDRFLAIQPAHAEGLVTRARAEVKLGELEAAARDYDAAIGSLTPPSRPRPEHYLERADALARIGPDRVDEAVRGLDDGLRLLGQPITLQMRAIELNLQRGRHDAALARVDQILSRPGRRERWLKRRGEILEQAGRPEEARRSYEEAVAALAALPASRRTVPATEKLALEIEAALARLAPKKQ